MASKLKIIPLGGLGEIGKNLTVYEYGKDMFLVDCGMGFPDQDLYGVDMVIPDISYLKANKNRIRGMVITHGHEDHIGAIPYVLKQLDMPIYATPLTAAIIELKLEEHDLLYHTQIFTKKPGDKFKLGCFEVEFIHTNHSIADSVALAIKTPIGTVVQTGDFKIDVTPLQGEMTDLTRFGELGREGVLALLMDSTNVERPGHSLSESKVHDRFDQLFKDCDKRIIVTTFASNVDRIRQIIDLAVKYKRKVGITGRSMENVVKLCVELGYMKVPDGILVDMKRIGSVPRNKLVILSTGSQGETMSALSRMAFSTHRQVDIQHQTGLGHFDLYALGVLLSTLLIGHQIRNAGTQIPHHAGNAFHLPDGAHRDGGDDLLGNVDASLLVGKRHITLIFSHCDSPFCILAANFISNVLFYHAIPKITTANLMP